MDFGKAFIFYYQTVFDLATILAYFFIAAGFALLFLKLPFTKKIAIKMGIVLVAMYGICVLFASFMFSLANQTGNQYAIQIIYALTFPIIAFVFCLVFSRDIRKTHRFIKTIILISSISVVEVLSKNIGFFVGTFSNNTFVITIARSFPYIFFPGVCLLLIQRSQPLLSVCSFPEGFRLRYRRNR